MLEYCRSSSLNAFSGARRKPDLMTRSFQWICLLAWLVFAGALVVPASAAPPQPDVDGYRQRVAPLLQTFCIKCHGESKPKGNLTLHDIDADLIAGRHVETWRMIQEQVLLGEMPPEEQKQPTAAERKLILDWIRAEQMKSQRPGVVTQEKLLLPQFGNYVDHDALFNEPAGPAIPATPRIWRIRPSIYESFVNSVADGTFSVGNPFSVTDAEGFKDYASLYFIDEPTTAMLLTNAERVVERQLKSNKFRAIRELVRDDRPPTPEEVARAIQEGFRLALQRPATEEEIKRFAAFHTQAVKTSDVQVGGRTVLMAILLQPEAMFRRETGAGPVDELGRQRLDQREIAYAIAFALGDQVDQNLLKLADEGKLATGEQVAAYVKARLGDSASTRGGNPRLMQFFREYFGYPEANEVFKDNPERGRHDPRLLINDLEVLIDRILQNDRDVLSELLTTNRYFIAFKLDPKTGQPVGNWDRVYPLEYQTSFNLPADWKWTADQPIELPKEERAGVLTHPAWLAAWSGNFDNHPVQRGKWIRTHLLGGSVADVPIGVDARIPEDEHKTLRQRLELVTNKAECWRCHNKMDDLGLTFEQFDHYGRYRRFEIGQPVVTRGEIARTGRAELDLNVKNPVELMHKLAGSKHVEQVFVRYVFRFFMGRNETLGDARTLQDAHKAYVNNGGSFNALVVSLLSSDSFLYRLAKQDRQ